MSRLFNGTTQGLVAAPPLSAFTAASISFWLWWDSYTNNDDLAFEYGANYATNSGFIVDPNASNNGGTFFNFGWGEPGKSWIDQFTRPSAAVWHHYLMTMNRAGTVNTAFVDGVSQTLTAVVHNTVTNGAFVNGNLNFMCRNAASLFGAGRLAEVALFGSVLTARNALALASGASPMRIGPRPVGYWPLLGGSPEPDYGGTQKGATLTATPTIVAHPRVRSFLQAA